jgi:hypothetical protein
MLHASCRGYEEVHAAAVKTQFHAADGQRFEDETTVTFASAAGTLSFPDTDVLWDGLSVPDPGTSRGSNGSLWDILGSELATAAVFALQEARK